MILALYDGTQFGADNFGEALIITLVAMFLVFGILLILYGLISVLKNIKFGNQTILENNQVTDTQQVTNQTVNLDEMDEDMKVAAIVATMDFKAETNEDAKLVSIKKID